MSTPLTLVASRALGIALKPGRARASSAAPPVGTPQGAGMPRKLRAAWLDRDAHLFLSMFNLFAGRRPLAGYSIAAARRRWRWMAMALGGGDPGVGVSDRVIDGPAGPIALRIFSPGRAATPWLAPGRRLRRALAARIHRLDAQLTYPARGA